MSAIKHIHGADLPDVKVIGYAERATMQDAREHFWSGGTILVNADGWLRQVQVTNLTTVHTSQTISWDALAEAVKDWRKRYSNQRYYIVHYSELTDRRAVDAIEAILRDSDARPAETISAIAEVIRLAGRDPAARSAGHDLAEVA